MIEINNLTKNFGDKKVLDNIALNIKEGEILGLMGKNGAGKTTLINSIVGRLSYSGTIYINKTSHFEYLSVSDGSIYFIPDTPHTYSFLTGIEQIQFSLELKGMQFDEYKTEIYDLLKQFDLYEEKDKILSKYSYGMRRKIALIVAIVIKPKILILDEPVLGLDALSIIVLKKHLREKLAGKCTIIFSSHIPDLINNVCDSVAIIHDQRIAFHSSEVLTANINIEQEYLKILGLT